MSTTTVRIPTDKRDVLKLIAAVERKDMMQILSELIDEYAERHRETLEILSNPEWVMLIMQSRRQMDKGGGGRSIHEL